jgi:hypothetical protein
MLGYMMSYVVWFLAFTAGTCCVAIMMVLTARIARRNPGLVMRYRRAKTQPPAHRPALADGLEFAECTHCSGGTQWLHPETGWGKIPKHMLYKVFLPDEGDFETREPIHANIQHCPRCAGRGGTYRERYVV